MILLIRLRLWCCNFITVGLRNIQIYVCLLHMHVYLHVHVSYTARTSYLPMSDVIIEHRLKGKVATHVSVQDEEIARISFPNVISEVEYSSR